MDDWNLADFLVDLHIHSNISPCSFLSVEEIFEGCKSFDIKGVAITDHNSISGFSKAEKLSEKYDLKLFLGYELQVIGGELLIYGIDKVLPMNLSPKFIIEKVRKLGGIVVAAHPFRNFFSSLENKIYDLNLDGIEVSDRTKHSLNKKAVNAAVKLGIAMTAGSDAHHFSDIGWCATKFRKEIKNNKEFMREIKENNVEPKIIL